MNIYFAIDDGRLKTNYPFHDQKRPNPKKGEFPKVRTQMQTIHMLIIHRDDTGDWIYQPVPSAEANGLFHHALEANEHRLGTIVPSDHHFGVTWQHWELLVAAVRTAVQVWEPTIEWILHCFQHFHLLLVSPDTKLTIPTTLRNKTTVFGKILHGWIWIRN